MLFIHSHKMGIINVELPSDSRWTNVPSHGQNRIHQLFVQAYSEEPSSRVRTKADFYISKCPKNVVSNRAESEGTGGGL